NAVKFTESGRVLLRADRKHGADGVVRVAFRVEDTGIGIAKEAQGRLFQPFGQAEASTTRRFGGSGLGLSICKGLVERLGGEIGFKSEADQGSVFHFQLDFARAADAAPEWPPGLLKGVGVSLKLRDPDEYAFVLRYLEHAGARADGQP